MILIGSWDIHFWDNWQGGYKIGGVSNARALSTFSLGVGLSYSFHHANGLDKETISKKVWCLHESLGQAAPSSANDMRAYQ